MQPGSNTQNSSDSHLPLHEIIERLDEGVAVFDASANLKFTNSSFRRMYPMLSDVLRPGLLWDIFLREAVNRGAISTRISQHLADSEANLDTDSVQPEAIETPAQHGQVFRLRISPTSDGGFFLSQTTAIDQTTGADAAREVEILMRKVLEACPASLTMSRVGDGRIIYRSPAATELLGTAKTSFSHFANREDRADFVTILLPDARVDDMRVTCLRPDGSQFPAQISARLIDYRDEEVIVANVEDLTDEIALQAELTRQREQLFQSEKLSAMGELLAGVAHELNNPLSIIVGNADMLQEELENTGFERRVDKVCQAAHRCVRIVRSFLSMARQEPLDLRPIPPDELIVSARDVTVSDAEVANVSIISTSVEGIPAILADEVQITQVIINLLTNAIHAIQGADTGDEIRIHCSHDPGSDFVRITIADNGPGVDDAIKNRIFDPLFTTKDIGKGTGVGLAYSHRIVSAHSGRIRLENSDKEGATFTLELPVAASI